MAKRIHIRFSFLWGVFLIAGFAVLGAVGGTFAKDALTSFRQTSYHRPTTTGVDKLKRQDRFASVYPVFQKTKQ